MSAPQYPSDYNPPCRGRCEVCGHETRGWTVRWLALCPMHWQALAKRLMGVIVLALAASCRTPVQPSPAVTVVPVQPVGISVRVGTVVTVPISEPGWRCEPSPALRQTAQSTTLRYFLAVAPASDATITCTGPSEGAAPPTEVWRVEIRP
jgi:hypothetical protein